MPLPLLEKEMKVYVIIASSAYEGGGQTLLRREGFFLDESEAEKRANELQKEESKKYGSLGDSIFVEELEQHE